MKKILVSIAVFFATLGTLCLLAYIAESCDLLDEDVRCDEGDNP